MMFSAISKSTEKFVIDNFPAILTGVGVVGMVGTAVLAAKGAYKSGQEIQNKQRWDDASNLPDGPFPSLDTKEKIKLTWTNYIPAAGVGTLTIASIVMAQRVNMKRAAALAAAYAITEKRFGDYKDKVAESLGLKKEEALRAELDQNTVNNNNSKQIIIAGGDVMFYDTMSGRYFRSSMEKIRRAQNDVNAVILASGCANLSEFYNFIDLEPTPLSDEVGWNEQMSMDFTTALKDGEPCVVLNFMVSPTRGWSDRYGG